jgi:hypothetical protein
VTLNNSVEIVQRHVVEEAEGVGRLTARAPGELALLDQVREVRLHFVVGDLVGRPAVVLRQAHHGGDVRLVGAWGEAAYEFPCSSRGIIRQLDQVR